MTFGWEINLGHVIKLGLAIIGLIGGYVKVDSLTGVDRFEQNARVRQVQWGFSDGTNSSTVTQNLADARSMQTTAVDVVATTVTMTVTATAPANAMLPKRRCSQPSRYSRPLASETC